MQLEASDKGTNQQMSSSTARDLAANTTGPVATTTASIKEQIKNALMAQIGSYPGPMSRTRGEEFLRKNIATPEVFEEMLRLATDESADCRQSLT